MTTTIATAQDVLTHAVLAQRATDNIVAIVVKALADDGTYNYWLTDLAGNRLGDVYPYAAGPRMLEACRRFGYIYSVIRQDGAGLTYAVGTVRQ